MNGRRKKERQQHAAGFALLQANFAYKRHNGILGAFAAEQLAK